MLAADTNIVVRLVTRDDPAQLDRIEALLAVEPLFVSLSVMLETGWVLRSAFGMARPAIAEELRWLLRLDVLRFEAHDALLWAIERYADGADLPDMIHLIANRTMSGFVTLDRKLARQAGPDTPLAIRSV